MAQGSPAAFLPLGKPQVLINGDADPAVPLQTVNQYAELASAKGDKVKVIPIPGGEHYVSSDAWGAHRRELRAEVTLPGILPLAGSALLLVLAAVAASLVPALRAARIDVMQALRSE